MRPNIVLLVVDALRACNLSLYGYDVETAPFLSRLSRLGVVFTNAYATTDQTDPSFTTIVSGRYPIVHGIVHHGPEVTRSEVRTLGATRTTFLQEFLKQEGYVTVAIDWLGRWHRRGFDLYASASELHGKLPSALSRRLTSVAVKTLALAPSWRAYRALHGLAMGLGVCYDKSATFVLEVAARLIDERLRRLKRPFFMLVHLWDTHTPLDDIPAYLVREFYDGRCTQTVVEMAGRIRNAAWREVVLRYHLKGVRCIDEVEPRYNAAIRQVDMALSEFVAFLDDRGLLDKTCIVITSDHGDNLLRGGVFIGHGGLFQRVVKVPLVMVGPELPEGMVVEALVQHVDIMPTLLQIARVEVPRHYYLDGKSLLETIETGAPPRGYAFAVSSTARRRYMIVKNGYKYVYSPSLLDAMDKYGGIWFNDVEELYDLRVDDDDMHNLVKSDPDVASELRRELCSLIKCLTKRRVRLMVSSSARLARAGLKRGGIN